MNFCPIFQLNQYNSAISMYIKYKDITYLTKNLQMLCFKQLRKNNDLNSLNF